MSKLQEETLTGGNPTSDIVGGAWSGGEDFGIMGCLKLCPRPQAMQHLLPLLPLTSLPTSPVPCLLV